LRKTNSHIAGRASRSIGLLVCYSDC
jgi:hypothetical protein